MRARSLGWYEARIAFGITSVLPLLLLPAFAAQSWLTWRNRAEPPNLIGLAWGFEHLLPLAALGAAHLMSIERETGFAELRATYPEPRWRRPLIRTGGGVGLLLLAGLVGLLSLLVIYGPFPLSETLLPAFAPALYLLGVALLAGQLSGSYWAAAGAVTGYWVFEVLTGGAVTRVLYLFNYSRPLPDVPGDLNRALLLGLGVALLLVNGYLAARRVRV